MILTWGLFRRFARGLSSRTDFIRSFSCRFRSKFLNITHDQRVSVNILREREARRGRWALWRKEISWDVDPRPALLGCRRQVICKFKAQVHKFRDEIAFRTLFTVTASASTSNLLCFAFSSCRSDPSPLRVLLKADWVVGVLGVAGESEIFSQI